MTITLVDVGSTANDGTGDPLRTAFQTVNTAIASLDGRTPKLLVAGKTAFLALTTSDAAAGDYIGLQYRDSVGDAGGGVFHTLTGTAASNGLTADSGIVYQNTAGNLTFVRVFTGPVKPSWFGAIGDGDSANRAADTAGCQAAINTGRSVDFGDTTSHYFIDAVAGLVVAGRTGTKYFGTGAKIQSYDTSVTQIMNFSGTNAYNEVYGLHFDGTGGGSTYTADDNMGIYATDTRLLKIHNCIFENFVGDAIQGEEIGGTGAREEGLVIYENVFKTATHDATSYSQYCIRLKNNCEYCEIRNNQAYDTVRFVSGVDGANSRVTGNYILGSVGVNWNGATTLRSTGLIYFALNSNAGKIVIDSNTINHNEVDCIPIMVLGDLTKPQNPSRIVGNQMIVNGSTNVGTQIYVEDQANIQIHDNHMRYNGGSTFPAITVDNCDDASVKNNYIDRGSVGIEVLTSTKVQIDGNENQATTPVTLDGTSTIVFKRSKTVGFRVTSAGNGINPWPFNDMTVATTGTGVYVITHGLGTNAMALTVMPKTAGLIASYAINATTATITIKDTSGVATNTDFVGLFEVPPDTELLEV